MRGPFWPAPALHHHFSQPPTSHYLVLPISKMKAELTARKREKLDIYVDGLRSVDSPIGMVHTIRVQKEVDAANREPFAHLNTVQDSCFFP